jgi:Xaa-Pro aminopeptidase
MVPRADLHQGEYVAPCDERLAWLTGFTGSAGFCIVLPEIAGVFIDGRYRVQVRAQVADCFTPVAWPEIQPAAWIAAQISGKDGQNFKALSGGEIGFDPWLHTKSEIDRLQADLPEGISLRAVDNLVDRVWLDRPAPPSAIVRRHPAEFAGQSAAEKRAAIAADIGPARACVLTLPDSICWLLNIRGADIARNPIAQALAILNERGEVSLYAQSTKFEDVIDHLGSAVTLHPLSAFAPALRSLTGPVRVDAETAPLQIGVELAAAGTPVIWGADPCVIRKAVKNPAEIAGMEAAHLRDGAAMVTFLASMEADQFQSEAGDPLSEIEIVTRLEAARIATGQLIDISFDTICGAGPNGAIVHYRVTHETNRATRKGDVLLIDSGGQYPDGTTDITRVVPVGEVLQDAVAPYTRVLQGMIDLSTARFPRGVAGAHLDALARAPLWRAGLDFDHGTGHGVGAALCVHEGPARISRASNIPLLEGMILSIEPGYYREGLFGIRIENLVRVVKAPDLGDLRDQLAFETLTLCPIDKRLIDPDLLTQDQRHWLNTYHRRVETALKPLVDAPTRAWLEAACAAL